MDNIVNFFKNNGLFIVIVLVVLVVLGFFYKKGAEINEKSNLTEIDSTGNTTSCNIDTLNKWNILFSKYITDVTVLEKNYDLSILTDTECLPKFTWTPTSITIQSNPEYKFDNIIDGYEYLISSINSYNNDPNLIISMIPTETTPPSGN